MAEGNESKSTSELATKLVQPVRAVDKTETILNTAKENSIKRHVETLREIINEVSKLVRTVEGEKITAKEDSAEIDTWMSDIEDKTQKEKTVAVFKDAAFMSSGIRVRRNLSQKTSHYQSHVN